MGVAYGINPTWARAACKYKYKKKVDE